MKTVGLKIENSNMNISKLYENYEYTDKFSNLSLRGFIEEFAITTDKKITNNENEIIVEIKLKNGNKYNVIKKLYLDKNRNILKMEVEDFAQNVRVYILYNEIKING